MRKPLIVLLGLLLITPSPAFPAAETAGAPFSRYLVGSWAGDINGLCGQLTIRDDGTFSRFIFEDDSLSSSGFVKAASSLVLEFTEQGSGRTRSYTYTVTADQLLLTEGGLSHRFRRLKAQLVRGGQTAGPAAPSADPSLEGTWGSMGSGPYSEWTFTGNGECRKLVPFDNRRSLSGVYIAGYGMLAILSKEDTLIAEYSADGNYLTISFPGGNPARFIRKSGPLVPLATVK